MGLGSAPGSSSHGWHARDCMIVAQSGTGDKSRSVAVWGDAVPHACGLTNPGEEQSIPDAERFKELAQRSHLSMLTPLNPAGAAKFAQRAGV